jgi:hypothetical protein
MVIKTKQNPTSIGIIQANETNNTGPVQPSESAELFSEERGLLVLLYSEDVDLPATVA